MFGNKSPLRFLILDNLIYQTELLRKAVEEGEDPCAAPVTGAEEEEEE